MFMTRGDLGLRMDVTPKTRITTRPFPIMDPTSSGVKGLDQ